jgi:hypothetical protein
LTVIFTSLLSKVAADYPVNDYERAIIPRFVKTLPSGKFLFLLALSIVKRGIFFFFL